MKGQITIINLLFLSIALLIYIIVFIPVLDPIINTTLAGMDQSSPTFSISATFIRLVPLVGILALSLTFINYANPNREGIGS